MPRANIITKPETILRHANGSEIVKNIRVGDAPRLRAAFSSRSGTNSKPLRAEFIKKGILTKAIAMAMAKGLPTKLNPNDPAILPNTESRLIKPNMAIPAAECGITTGRSIIPVTIFFNLNFLRANKYARGIAGIEKTKVAVNAIQIVTQNELKTSFSAATCSNCSDEVEIIIPINGAAIKSSNKPLSAISIRVNAECFINFKKSKLNQEY